MPAKTAYLLGSSGGIFRQTIEYLGEVLHPYSQEMPMIAGLTGQIAEGGSSLPEFRRGILN
jgi:hypothetical protein